MLWVLLIFSVINFGLFIFLIVLVIGMLKDIQLDVLITKVFVKDLIHWNSHSDGRKIVD